MISNRCTRKSLVTNCNSIISKNYLRFLVDSNDFRENIFKLKKLIPVGNTRQEDKPYTNRQISH